MKKLPHILTASALAFALVAVTTTVPAADGSGGPRHEQRMGRHLDRLTEALDLSDTQRTQLETVMSEQAEKRRALREETRARVNGVLTADQQAQFKEMREKRREARRGRRHEHRHDRKSQDSATQ